MSVPARVLLDGLPIHLTSGYALAPDGWDLAVPEPRSALVEYARRHGAADDTAYLGPAVASLSGMVMGTTHAELHQRLDTLRARCAPGREALLQWERYPGDVLWQMAVRLGGRFETRHQNGHGALYAVTLTGADPLALSAELHEAGYDPTTGHQGIGVEFDLTFDLAFTGTAVSSMNLTNAGNMPSPPLWRIEGPVTDPVIESLTTGEEIATTADLSAGQELWIDVGRRTARLGAEDGTLRLDLIDEASTAWFDLTPGVNEVRLTGAGMTTGQTTLTARWRDARLPD
ncbi:MAG: hypothetical protein RIB67_07455 [Miltoncostaeaceae bacterium]